MKKITSLTQAQKCLKELVNNQRLYSSIYCSEIVLRINFKRWKDCPELKASTITTDDHSLILSTTSYNFRARRFSASVLHLLLHSYTTLKIKRIRTNIYYWSHSDVTGTIKPKSQLLCMKKSIYVHCVCMYIFLVCDYFYTVNFGLDFKVLLVLWVTQTKMLL